MALRVSKRLTWYRFSYYVVIETNIQTFYFIILASAHGAHLPEFEVAYNAISFKSVVFTAEIGL